MPPQSLSFGRKIFLTDESIVPSGHGNFHTLDFFVNNGRRGVLFLAIPDYHVTLLLQVYNTNLLQPIFQLRSILGGNLNDDKVRIIKFVQSFYLFPVNWYFLFWTTCCHIFKRANVVLILIVTNLNVILNMSVKAIENVEDNFCHEGNRRRRMTEMLYNLS